METTVIVNDLQMPFQDVAVVSLVVDFIKTLRPHRIILNGDVVDCYSISNFTKEPMKLADVALERSEAVILMDALYNVPEKIWIGGNHEDRLRRYLWRQAPELA